MKMLIDGRFSAQVLVVMAVVAGAWHLGVRSLHRGLAQARAETVGAREEIAAHELQYGTEAGLPRDLLATLSARENAMLSRSAKSADAAKIYESLGAIASSRNVRIDRIEPARGPARDSRAASTNKGATCEAIGYSIEATGEYADLVAFADTVQADLGVTKVLSLRIGPATTAVKSRTMLSASIETAHFKLLTPSEKQAGKESPR